MNSFTVSFYQALLGGMLTFYGIGLAVIIAAAQIVQSNLNFRVNWPRLLGSRNVVAIVIATGLNLILISAAVVAMSFDHNIMGGDQHSYRIFGSLIYLAWIVASIVWIIYIAVRCTRKILSTLLPTNLIKDLMPNMASSGDITNYVLYRYATEPHKPFLIDTIRYASDTVKVEPKPKKDLSEDQAKDLLDKVLDGSTELLAQEQGRFNLLKTSGRKVNDPLVPLISVMRSAIRENDIQTLAQAHDQLLELLLKCKVEREKDISVANSLESQINGCVINYYSDMMTSIFDMSVSTDALSCAKEIVRFTFDASDSFKPMQSWSSKGLIYNFWEYAGTIAVRKDLPSIFITVLRLLSEMIIIQIRAGEEESDTLSKLDRLIEKRFMHSAPEKEPVLEDRSMTSDYAEIINSLVNLGAAYEDRADKASPHLYFVALSFVSKHLIQNYLDESGSDERIKDTVLGFMIDHISFARQAAFKGNSEGFYVAYIEFKLFDWRLEDNNPFLDPFKSYLLTGLIDLADIAIKNRSKLKPTGSYTGHGWFVEEILKVLQELHSKWPHVVPEQRTISDLTVKSYDGESGSSEIIAKFVHKVRGILPGAS